jgi:hypothetical protein
MDYEPGILHEFYQTSNYFSVGFDFTISVCKENFRLKNLSTLDDYDNYTENVDLVKDDVIKIKYFKSNSSSLPYVYLESVIRSNGDIIDYNLEISAFGRLGYIRWCHNTENSGLFTEVTKIYQRDKKINQILN